MLKLGSDPDGLKMGPPPPIYVIIKQHAHWISQYEMQNVIKLMSVVDTLLHANTDFIWTEPL